MSELHVYRVESDPEPGAVFPSQFLVVAYTFAAASQAWEDKHGKSPKRISHVGPVDVEA